MKIEPQGLKKTHLGSRGFTGDHIKKLQPRLVCIKEIGHTGAQKSSLEKNIVTTKGSKGLTDPTFTPLGSNYRASIPTVAKREPSGVNSLKSMKLNP